MFQAVDALPASLRVRVRVRARGGQNLVRLRPSRCHLNGAAAGVCAAMLGQSVSLARLQLAALLQHGCWVRPGSRKTKEFAHGRVRLAVMRSGLLHDT